MKNNTNRIFRELIPQTIKVRKNKVDVEALQEELRNHKIQSKLSNKKIALKLNKPMTLVEHWFRKDSSFSIPDADIWFSLKELLKIDDDRFDRSIIEFEYRYGVYEKSERCYYDYGISPTITCDGNINIIQEIKN